MLFDADHRGCAGARAQYRCISCDRLQNTMTPAAPSVGTGALSPRPLASGSANADRIYKWPQQSQVGCQRVSTCHSPPDGNEALISAVQGGA